MKNITFLTVLVIITIFFTLHNSLFCQEQPSRRYELSIGPQFGFTHGQVLELVYPEYTPSPLLSELRWDVKPMVFYGANINFGRIDPMKALGFFASFSIKAGVPGDTGIMEDRDWMSMENTSLTHFSSHTNKTNKFYSLDAEAGISIPVLSLFYTKPFISASMMHFSFTGRDGYVKYARQKQDNPAAYYPIDDRPDTYTLSGDCINYTQDWLLFAFGFKLGRQLPANFSFDLSFQISPISFCVGIDEHIARKIIFHDVTRWGLFLEPGARLSYTLERLEFSFDFAWRKIFNTRGETYISYNKENYALTGGEGGAAMSILNSSFLVMVHF